mgnify:CR=1 FL=1
MKAIIALLTGGLFGAGLVLSGMTDTGKVIGFLDVTGAWDPTLMFVMAGALAVTAVCTPWIVKWQRPLLAEVFSLPLRTEIDGRLIGGSALFGLGWAFWGYCPGPALTALTYGATSTVVFCVAMLTGMWLSDLLDRRRDS